MPLAITRLVIENGLLQALSEVHDKPVTVAELGKKTNLDELLTRESLGNLIHFAMTTGNSPSIVSSLIALCCWYGCRR